jgi:hypothetical protein
MAQGFGMHSLGHSMSPNGDGSFLWQIDIGGSQRILIVAIGWGVA